MAAINARKTWNETPFELKVGSTYRFTVSGTWKDWTTPCDARGYDSDKLRLFEPLRRVRGAKWFSLIGALDKETETCFDIGRLIESGGTYTAQRAGRLFCFANDVSFMYWNNCGSIELNITEVGN